MEDNNLMLKITLTYYETEKMACLKRAHSVFLKAEHDLYFLAK